MQVVTIHIARTTLSQLLRRVEAGEEIVLARGKKPVAKLVPFHAPSGRRRFGTLKGKIHVGPEFFQPLSEEQLKRWG